MRSRARSVICVCVVGTGESNDDTDDDLGDPDVVLLGETTLFFLLVAATICCFVTEKNLLGRRVSGMLEAMMWHALVGLQRTVQRFVVDFVTLDKADVLATSDVAKPAPCALNPL